MEFGFRLLTIFAFLFVALGVTCLAAQSSEDYWKKLLPNTVMPKTIHESLKSEDGTGVHVGNQGVDVSVGKPGTGSTDVHVGKGGASVNTRPKGKHTSVYVHPKGNPFIYQYAATKTQLQANQNVALFFQEKDLKLRTQMNLHFTKTTNNETPLLPRKIVESIPFSSEKMPEILSRFEVAPDSEEAKVMQETIKECEAKGIEGEEKYCATSLESMVDYATSKLGKKLDVVSTYVEKKKGMQNYVFTGVKKMSNSKAMICHKMNYACVVFYCHKTETTKTYMVSLVGNDGTKVKAAVICHIDTSKWNPKHLAFQVLKVKPGAVPICHFLPEDHIVWVSK